MEAEFGMPQWGFGMSNYAFASPQKIICAYIEKGISRLSIIDTQTKNFEAIDSCYTDLRYVRASGGKSVMRAASQTESAAIVSFDVETRNFKVLRRSNNLTIDAGYFSFRER